MCKISSFVSRLSLGSLNLDKQTVKGSTALHYCCLTDNSECLKLLLRGKASIEIGKETHQQLTGRLWCVHCPSVSFSFSLSFSVKSFYSGFWCLSFLKKVKTIYYSRKIQPVLMLIYTFQDDLRSQIPNSSVRACIILVCFQKVT